MGDYDYQYRKVIFNVTETFPTRTTEMYHQHLNQAVSTNSPAFGVKGPTKLSEILKMPSGMLFDPMHLLYLGVNKALLSIILKNELVDCLVLSSVIEKVGVPHYFRRKPRNILTEFALWKAQEHRVFLLYYAPLVFMYCWRLSQEQPNDIFFVYCLLSTSVYLLSSEYINECDIVDTELYIKTFQSYLVSLLGDSVRTVTLHCLSHLPEQVRRFGPLQNVSAMLFENLNRQLKQSITGTRGCAEQMINRYLNFQISASSSKSCESVPHAIGKSPPFKRFKVGDLVFHTSKYDKFLKCKSCYVFLNDLRKFAKIKALNVINNETFTVQCRVYDDMFPIFSLSSNLNLPPHIMTKMSNNCPYFFLKKGGIREISPVEFSHHAIIMKEKDSYFGVKVMNNYEHE